ncbi:Uncharacterised protein [Providencia rettgeri]|uniref:Invasin n=1 Tax=Providencia rettgeri TaxID=587 RepID=A0A379LS54_PRORE|nr:Uncharacterised protein [Providencia rettgeri]
MKLTDWAGGVASGAYAITAGNADQANSSAMVDNTTYVAGTDITVTVTLKDAQGNSVRGQASALTGTVTYRMRRQKRAAVGWTMGMARTPERMWRTPWARLKSQRQVDRLDKCC